MTFTQDEFTAAMREAVAERGADYVYPFDNADYRRAVDGDFVSGCRYRTRYSHKPACLIGVALSKVAPEFKPVEGASAEAVMCAVLGITGQPGFVYAAGAAQRRQDDGKTWGEALSAYERYLGL